MPRDTIKRLILRSKQGDYRSRWPWLHRLMNQSRLLHVNKHSVSLGVFIGFFCAMLPILGQAILACLFAILFKANLPISIISTMITNPLTMVPIYTGIYLVGLDILDMTNPFPKGQISIEFLFDHFDYVWKPMLAGTLPVALCVATLGYLASRTVWRLLVLRSWRKRQRLRLAQKSAET